MNDDDESIRWALWFTTIILFVFVINVLQEALR